MCMYIVSKNDIDIALYNLITDFLTMWRHFLCLFAVANGVVSTSFFIKHAVAFNNYQPILITFGR